MNLQLLSKKLINDLNDIKIQNDDILGKSASIHRII